MLYTYSKINEMTDRQAMSLPAFYRASRVEDNINQIYQQLINCSKEQLITIAESLDYSIDERYVAGQLLAQIGDPRIDTTHPIMITIQAAEAVIGINARDIELVLNRYAHVGVLREWIEKETPAFKTRLDTFKIAKYLVTNQEYRNFLMDTHYNELPLSWEFGIYPIYKANHPVYGITELAIEAYIKWLSEKTNRHFRLPTEYEWEYAASGLDHYEYPWGNIELNDAANTLEEQIYTTTPIGIFPKGNSPFGVADMAGNVEEYVATYYHEYPNGKYILDDLVNSSGSYRICRGGSFTRHRDLARTSRRHGHYNKNIYVIGFRVAETI